MAPDQALANVAPTADRSGPDLTTTAGKLADLKRRVAEVANAGSERAVE